MRDQALPHLDCCTNGRVNAPLTPWNFIGQNYLIKNIVKYLWNLQQNTQRQNKQLIYCVDKLVLWQEKIKYIL